MTRNAFLLGPAAARAGEWAGGAAVEKKELSGKVIKSEASILYLEHMGAVVPIEVGRDTKFSGVRSAGELAEGQEVRASFTVKDNTKNVADTISLGSPPSPARTPWWEERHEDYGG